MKYYDLKENDIIGWYDDLHDYKWGYVTGEPDINDEWRVIILGMEYDGYEVYIHPNVKLIYFADMVDSLCIL